MWKIGEETSAKQVGMGVETCQVSCVNNVDRKVSTKMKGKVYKTVVIPAVS